MDLLDHESVKVVFLGGRLATDSPDSALLGFHFICGPQMWFSDDKALNMLSREASSLLDRSLEGLVNVIILVGKTLRFLIECQLLLFSGLREVNQTPEFVEKATSLSRVGSQTFLAVDFHQIFSIVDGHDVPRRLEIIE